VLYLLFFSKEIITIFFSGQD